MKKSSNRRKSRKSRRVRSRKKSHLTPADEVETDVVSEVAVEESPPEDGGDPFTGESSEGMPSNRISGVGDAAPFDRGISFEPVESTVESDHGGTGEPDHSTRSGAGRFSTRELEAMLPIKTTESEVMHEEPGDRHSSRNLVAQEFVMSRLGHLSRRLEELHQAEVNRFSEERKETWILVFALSVVLIFCFAAFFMNQMEVRDLRSGLEEELERRSVQTAASIEDTLDDLQLQKLPKLHASLEALIREKDQRDVANMEQLTDEVRRQGSRSEAQLEERLRNLEESLAAILQLSRDIHLQRLEAEAGMTKEAPKQENLLVQQSSRDKVGETTISKPGDEKAANRLEQIQAK